MVVTSSRHHVVLMAHRRKVQTGVLCGKICLELLVQLKLASLLFDLVDVHVCVDQRHQIVRSLQQSKFIVNTHQDLPSWTYIFGDDHVVGHALISALFVHYLRQNLAVLPDSVPDDLILDLVAATPSEVHEVAPALGRVDRDPQLVQLRGSIALDFHLRRGRLSSLGHCNRVYLFATNY